MIARMTCVDQSQWDFEAENSHNPPLTDPIHDDSITVGSPSILSSHGVSTPSPLLSYSLQDYVWQPHYSAPEPLSYEDKLAASEPRIGHLYAGSISAVNDWATFEVLDCHQSTLSIDCSSLSASSSCSLPSPLSRSIFAPPLPVVSSGFFSPTDSSNSNSDSERSDQSFVSEESTRSVAESVNTQSATRRQRAPRKRRLTVTNRTCSDSTADSTPPVTLTEEEKRERNKQSACDYRKRRKVYVTELEEKLANAEEALATKNEALRRAEAQLVAMKQQVAFMQRITINATNGVKLEKSNGPAHESVAVMEPVTPDVPSRGVGRPRRVAGTRSAMSIAMLTILSCLLCQFGFFDSSIGSQSVPADSETAPVLASIINDYHYVAPDCSGGGCRQSRSLLAVDDTTDKFAAVESAFKSITGVDYETFKSNYRLENDSEITLTPSINFSAMKLDSHETEWENDNDAIPVDSWWWDEDSIIEHDRSIGDTRQGEQLDSLLSSLFVSR